MDVALYQLRSEVNSAFFSAFLLEKRAAEYEALVADLDARLAAVRARVEAGTALGRDAAEIEAERVRAGLQRDEARASRRASLAILADLVGQPIDTAAVLVLPADEPERTHPVDLATVAALRRRPEFEQFRQLALPARAGGRRTPPPRTGPGCSRSARPASDCPGWTSSARRRTRSGRRVSGSNGGPGPGARPAGRRRRSGCSRTSSPPRRQALGRRLARAVAADLEDIARLTAALADDERVVALRAEVERQARAQYDEGAITTPDYVEARTDVLEARLALERHRVELAQARSRYLTTLGITPRTASETP